MADPADEGGVLQEPVEALDGVGGAMVVVFCRCVCYGSGAVVIKLFFIRCASCPFVQANGDVGVRFKPKFKYFKILVNER